MTKMLTLFGKEPKDMKWEELHRERRCQKFLILQMKAIAKRCRKAAEEGVETRKAYNIFRQDKADFCDLYIQNLEALVTELDYWLERRAKPKRVNNSRWKGYVKKDNARRRQNYLNDNNMRDQINKQAEREGNFVHWDKDKFLLIANDRGYQTEELVTTVVSRELNMSRTRARILLDNGRFTWGQILVLGGLFEMTPKEFCDTFLAGYFVDTHGDYRANYENIAKAELLKRAIKPIAKPDPTFEEIYVDSDGRPLGEEEWWDD